MTHPNPLQAFVDDELAHAGAVLDRVIDTVYQRWRHQSARATRAEEEATRLLRTMRGNILLRTMQRLREEVEEAMRDALADPDSRRDQSPLLEMSLLDEESLSVDIEISRIVEAVKSAAEFELRELQAYTSAMTGDRNVARDTNPLRPEIVARSLWSGLAVMPVERRLQLKALRDMAPELAARLREVYAAACFRLAERGVVPAMRRTIMPLGASNKPLAEIDVTYARFDLRQLSQSIHAALDSAPGLGGPTGNATQSFVPGPAVAPTPSPPPPLAPPWRFEAARPAVGDPKVIELVNRLFEAMRADRRLPEEVGLQLLRLQPLVLNIAVSEPDLLDSHDHVVWRFLTRFAFTYATRVDGDDDQGVAFAEGLIDQLATGSGDDSSPFSLALRRLANFEQQSFERRVKLAQPQIDKLRKFLAAAMPMSTNSAPLDIGTLDTIPVNLMAERDAGVAESQSAWVDRRSTGTWVRALIKGQWRRLQLLWLDEFGETWLLVEIATDRYWALRRRAVKTLADEGLATALAPRSLVRSAASRVIRSLASESPKT
jgi:hypothetical protein